MKRKLVLFAAALGCGAVFAGLRPTFSPIGETRVWDFTTGTPPAHCQINPAGLLGEKGLSTANFTNLASRGGATLGDFALPDGAFFLEVEVEVGDQGPIGGTSFTGHLFDSMGVGYASPKATHEGLQLIVTQQPNGFRTPEVKFGFGNRTCSATGEMLRVRKGSTTTFSVLYGASGRVVVGFGGQYTERMLPLSGGLAPSSRYRPTVGSRPVSLYHNFDGYVRKVTLTPIKRDEIVIRCPDRAAFVRGEKDAALKLEVINCQDRALTDVTLACEQSVDGMVVAQKPVAVGRLEVGKPVATAVPLETRFTPGMRKLRLKVRAKFPDGAPFECVRELDYGIGPVLPDMLPVTLWGYAAAGDFSLIKKLGFTHGYVYAGGPSEPDGPWDAKPVMDMFDRGLVEGLAIARAFGPSILPPDCTDTNRYNRYDCLGRPFKRVCPEVSNPELQERIGKIAARDAEIFKDHPAFKGLLAYSEWRDHARPSFNVEKGIYRQETGRDIPKGVDGKTFGLKNAEKRFPDGVVPDDDEIHLYYDWYFKGGDGWPKFHAAIFDEFNRRMPQDDFMSFWDPAVRWGPVWGIGGSARMLNQWCYAAPEPMNCGSPCEEILAAVDGRPGQKASIMTQIICYRSKNAPVEEKPKDEPEWARKFPKGKFPTIPPDVLEEATWTMLAKPVQSIMYHGWNAIWDMKSDSYYIYTNPESTRRMEKLLKGVVAPLGPVLKRLGRAKPRVAVFESLTNCEMGGPASWGWSAPAITCLQRARLDPRVVYEQTIERDGLDSVDVLYAPQCRFLTKSMVERLRAFQKRGGILVGDKELVKALKADILLPIASFDPVPVLDLAEEMAEAEKAKPQWMKTREGTVRIKTDMQKAGETLRRELAKRGYRPDTDSSTPEIVVYNRRWHETDYVVAVNDRRTFGDYFGPWGRCMEKALPTRGKVTHADPERKVGAVYELSRGGKVAFARGKDGEVVTELAFDMTDGRFLVYLPRPIESVRVEAADRVDADGRIAVKMTVLDSSSRPVPALLPVDIRLRDSCGREIDGGGAACAVGGVAEVVFTVNRNDPSGDYTLVCTDRASGLSEERKVGR